MAVGYRATPRSAVLVEREDELAALDAQLQAAIAGNGRLVVVRGEAGIGKTSLIRAFIGSLDPDLTALVGAADGVSTPRPFEPFYEMGLSTGVAELIATGAPRAELYSALLGALRDRNARLLVVEDIHWAEDGTLEFLMYLARRIDRMPLLAIASVRDEADTSPAARGMLARLAWSPNVQQLEVPALTPGGVAEIVADEPLDAALIHHLTGGNPFFVTEVVAAGMESLPTSIRDVIRANVERLSAPARAAVEALAVLGSRVEPWLLAAVAGEDLVGIDEAMAAGLVRSDAEGVAFRHELTRVGVLEQLPVFRGIAIHRRALAALTRARSSDHVRLAYHAEGAADAASTFRHATAAGREAMRVSANRAAAAQFRRALRFGDVAEPPDRAEALENLSRVLYLTNEVAQGAERVAEALEIRRSLGDPLRIADDLTALSHLRLLRNDVTDAIALLTEARALLEPLGQSPELARAYRTLGRVTMFVGQRTESMEWTSRALDVATSVGDEETRIDALVTRATVATEAGDPGGRGALVHALAMARAHRLAEQEDRAVYNLAEACRDVGELHEALAYFDELQEVTVRSDLERCSVLTSRSLILDDLGRWDEAVASADAGLAGPRTHEWDRIDALTTKAVIAIRRGESEPDDLLALAESYVPDIPIPGLLWKCVVPRLEAAWIRDAPSDVLGALTPAREIIASRARAWERGELAVWLQRIGEPPGDDASLPLAHRLLLTGRHRDAADAFDALALPYDAAMALADSSAHEDLREAHERMTRLGAAATAAMVARRLREVGRPVPRGPRASTRSHLGGLTEREAEVALLAADGLTNREIAVELVLSEKTVGHHVSAVLGKLGARRRSDIGRQLSARTVGVAPASI